MFDLIKQKVSLLGQLETDLEVTFRSIGDRNWKIDGDTESCPFCHHKDCFRVMQEDHDLSAAFYKCFSCGDYGDVITWKSKWNKIEMGEAARALAKEHDIQLPNDYNPVQQVFTLAANYYHSCLTETCNRPFPLLSGKTPTSYQTEIRKHKVETLTKYKIGFSDGGLVDYLESIGTDPEIIKESGLLNSKGDDFLPRNCFIYPHFVKGRVSHFTFKDPIKKVTYQLPKKSSLNGYLFYGQDTFSASNVVILVEGENDWLSVMETGKVVACLATIGQISREQLDWLRTLGKDKKLITLFDPDDAGNKYREKIESLRGYFGGLTHVLPPEGKDIDDLLSNGGDIVDIIKNNQVKVEVQVAAKHNVGAGWSELTGKEEPVVVKAPARAVVVEARGETQVETAFPLEKPVKGPGATQTTVPPIVVEESQLSIFVPPVIEGTFTGEDGEKELDEDGPLLPISDDDSIFQRGNMYFKARFAKDGTRAPDLRLSDFIIELKYIYRGMSTGDRLREVIIRRNDGYASEPILIDSEVKVSIKAFKILVAKAADAEWLGKEQDLDAMWRLVFRKYPEVLIDMPLQIGLNWQYKGWIFGNVFITHSGSVIPGDDNNIFWTSGKSSGIKPESLVDGASGGDSLSGMPILCTSYSKEEADEMLGIALNHLTTVLECRGKALLCLGWIYSNVYSDLIFKTNNGMSLLLLWGLGGAGKTTIVNWLRAIYGFHPDMGKTTVRQIKSGVGFQRQGQYFSSLPMFFDEVRDDADTREHLGMIRAWYDRAGRNYAAISNGSKVVSQKIRANLVIAGEDLPQDPATRERCVLVRVPKTKLEANAKNKVPFDWMQSKMLDLSAIGLHWIKDAINEKEAELLAGFQEIEAVLKEGGATSRTSKVWGSTGYFANRLNQQYSPDYDFLTFLQTASTSEATEQRDASSLNTFFESVEIMMSQDNPKITGAHVRVEGDKLHMWFPAVHKAVMDDRRGRDGWSKNALLKSIREEKYFVSDDKKLAMGLSGSRRTVLTIDLELASEVLKSLAEGATG